MLKEVTEGSSPAPSSSHRSIQSADARCRRKFLGIFPEGFSDRAYLAVEREYKVATHWRWQAKLARTLLEELMRRREWAQIARTAVAVESQTKLLLPLEKTALRDAVTDARGARAFVEGLHEFLHGRTPLPDRFEAWRDAIASLARGETRVILSWPVLTAFPFIADPHHHMYLEPRVTRQAAQRYGFAFDYESKPQWSTYASLLAFAHTVARDLHDLGPRDHIDVHSFIQVQGADEYA